MINKQIFRKLRREKNLTQKQVAERLGVNEATISGYETGTFNPPIDKLKELAKIYEVDMVVLLGETQEPIEKTSSDDTINKQWQVILSLQEEKKNLLELLRIAMTSSPNFPEGNENSVPVLEFRPGLFTQAAA